MSYLGRDVDKISNIETLDNITFDGSSSYTLQKGSVNFVPSSANAILISIDGVVQSGNFTVSGSTIDFGTAIAGTSTCNFIIHLGVGLITAPSDGTVTNAKLSSGSLAKLSATGTKDATTFLRGDNTFAAAGSPSIDDNGDATAITINSSEQVGIGTTSPAFKLEVNAGSAGNIARFTDGVNANTVIKTSGSVTTFGPDTSNSLAFQTNNSERMKIDTSGSIILTNTPPIKTFDLGTTGTVTLADNGFIEFTNSSGVWFITEQSNTGQSAVLAAGGGSVAVIGQVGSAFNASDGGTFRFFRQSGGGYRFKNAQGSSCVFGICHISLRNST